MLLNNSARLSLLIAPEGIEIYFYLLHLNQRLQLLIAPEGIEIAETLYYNSIANAALNRTRRNWNIFMVEVAEKRDSLLIAPEGIEM